MKLIGMRRFNMLRKIFLALSLSVAVFLLGPNSIYAQTCRLPHKYQWHHFYNPFIHTQSSAIKADNNGNLYVAASGETGNLKGRIIQKYNPDGTPIYGAEGEASPWYQDTEPFSEVDGIPWQKIAIDDHNQKIYVLFATHRKILLVDIVNQFWLACHELETGAPCETWAWSNNDPGIPVDLEESRA